MQSMFPPLNSLEIARAEFAFMGNNDANIKNGARKVVGAGRLAAVLPLITNATLTAGEATEPVTVASTVAYPTNALATISGSVTYWPDSLVVYAGVSGAATLTVQTSPDGINFYDAVTWTASAAGTTVLSVPSAMAVQVISSATVTANVQVQVQL